MKGMTKAHWLMIALCMLVILSGCVGNTGENFSGQKTEAHNREQSTEPTAGVMTREAVIKGSYQEVDLKINVSGYYPDVIIAKRGILLKINAHSEEDAGCATEIVFPDFNITKTVPAGSSGLIEILPSQEGTFNFRCSMDMFRGKLIIRG